MNQNRILPAIDPHAATKGNRAAGGMIAARQQEYLRPQRTAMADAGCSPSNRIAPRACAGSEPRPRRVHHFGGDALSLQPACPDAGLSDDFRHEDKSRIPELLPTPCFVALRLASRLLTHEERNGRPPP